VSNVDSKSNALANLMPNDKIDSLTTYPVALGLDVGDKRIGVAIADPLGIAAHPLVTIERNKGKDETFKNITEIIRNRSVAVVVIGYPIELSGNIGSQAQKVEKFKNELERELKKVFSSLEIVLWDERFTSTQADHFLIGSKLKDRARRAARDQISAALILESYLNANANRS
jgi:putative Holliday junction resolvase